MIQEAHVVRNGDATAPAVVDTRGQLPPFWDRQVAFFANLLALFYGNEAEMECLSREIGEIDSYGGRLVPIIDLMFRGGNNLLLLERKPDEALCRYFEDTLGLTLPELEVMSHAEYLTLGNHFDADRREEIASMLEVPKTHDSRYIDGFVTDKTLTKAAAYMAKETITTEPGSRRGNNKWLLHQFLEAEGLPVLPTLLAASAKEVAVRAAELIRMGFAEAVVKAQIGASGIGMIQLEHPAKPETFPEIPELIFYEGPCMVQGWVKKGVQGVTRKRSPSVQTFIDNEGVYLYDVTEQILSHASVHEGNISPPEYFDDEPALREELLRQAGKAGQWLFGLGYRGTASVDFLVVNREDKDVSEVYVCEINARVTGATYPSVLARHFTPEGSWLLRNIRLRKSLEGEQVLDLFRKPGHLYSPENKAGVLPINFNFGDDDLIHKGQFLCLAETPEQCHRYLDLAQNDIPAEWSFDRD